MSREQMDELRRMARIAAHDLRSPAWRAREFAKLVAEQLESQGGDETIMRDNLAQIDRVIRSADQVLELIDALADYVTLVGEAEAVDPTETTEDVALGGVLEEVRTRLAPAIASTEATLDVAADLPAVRGSRAALTRLFENLVANALTFRREAPPVVRVDARANGRSFEVVVTDNGIGIAPEHHEAVFEPLKRLHPKGRYPGPGLGLAVCRRIVRALGGSIHVESEPGAGSRFLMLLPRDGMPSPPPSHGEASAAAQRSHPVA